jgi:hypothetical protein
VENGLSPEELTAAGQELQAVDYEGPALRGGLARLALCRAAWPGKLMFYWWTMTTSSANLSNKP